ncbi:meiosis-specific protein MEI4 [Cottoperca gobio]|uniref:Meiosis-specific protein MEI4 n=1 Tax=Cottoperca gobio TaxID=56716 RepID=A0A6J2P6U5_COTGO|nr:meiosis-specific protein MEI4 [Cottoperca gobio]
MCNVPEGSSQADWLFTKAKVSLAVAIIKNKPLGMSGREYAEALACRLKTQDESWKEKAQGLQLEVLRLRQELLIRRVTSNMQSSTEAAGYDNTMDPSQDLFGPVSAACSADFAPGCDSETPDFLQQDPQPELLPQDPQPELLPQDPQPELLPQDPQPALTLPQPPFPSSHCGFPRGESMLPHVQFLQSLCALHRVEGTSRGLESLWFSPDGGAGSVLADSVCQLLDSVVALCGNPPPLGPGVLVLQACRVAAQAMDLFCSQRLPSVEFMRRVEGSLRELTELLLLHSNQPNRLQAAEKLMEYLMTLGSSNMSRSFLIRHILSRISALADQLWRAFQEQDDFPLDQHQNSCYLFWILEELLQNSKVPCRVEVGAEKTGFLRHLERRAFLLSDEFPLFGLCMWRIGGFLAASDR